MKHALQGSCERAFYKMIVDRASGAVIGLHLLGPEAPEILQIAAVAMRAGATKQHFDDTMALHPTMADELVLLRSSGWKQSVYGKRHNSRRARGHCEGSRRRVSRCICKT